jgi:YidC/Oxa1 family membrane protein insertase
VVFAVGGIAFPIGVLFYWTTTNVWTMGQQFYVIRRNPAPGTPAFDAKVARDRAKGRLTEVAEEEAVAEAHGDQPPRQRQRQQPKRQSREQRKRSSGARGADDATNQSGQKGQGGESGEDGQDDQDDEGKTA